MALPVLLICDHDSPSLGKLSDILERNTAFEYLGFVQPEKLQDLLSHTNPEVLWFDLGKDITYSLTMLKELRLTMPFVQFVVSTPKADNDLRKRALSASIDYFIDEAELENELSILTTALQRFNQTERMSHRHLIMSMVIIANPAADYLEEVKSLIESEFRLSYLGTIDSSKALVYVPKIEPKIIWIALDGDTGAMLKLVQKLKSRCPEANVITSNELFDKDLLTKAHESGACDFIDRERMIADFYCTVQAISLKVKAESYSTNTLDFSP